MRITGEHTSVTCVRQSLSQVTHQFAVRQNLGRLAEPAEFPGRDDLSHVVAVRDHRY